ncbi:hybrid sensor histidine kinase/response regulator [Catenuloplanes indicus]|uniref:histidine kinase n=1 Tax=Catenuloplanes indicus TaxID=137267 RepID=A0AAE3VUC2_9ACTN|nr:PAS domain-containing hybrid sensor histidine kinase/response regulator [Catenuloplanes indicus]MDQ0363866.1 PAS domain S-box-containing protein [Catenuloplanes indicus]
MFPLETVAAQLVEAAADAIIGTDQDGRIVLVNAEAERMFGYTRAQLLDQPIEALIPEPLRARHPRLRDGYVREPKPRPMGAGRALSARRADGSSFPTEISLSAIHTEDGILIVSVVRDVTDRVRSEAKFRALLEAAPDAIVGVATDGRIALVNAQAERMFGYPRDELFGQPIEILIPESLRPRHPAHRARYFADPRPRPMGEGQPLSAVRKDGTRFPAEISLSSIETEDGLIVSAAVRDVTDRVEADAERERLKAAAERERLEARLHQSQRLESLGQLAGGVAHDFNNLLAVMLNYTNFVAELIDDAAAREPDGAWADAAADLRQVIRAGNRATELTHQLLAFGRREVVRPRVLDLNSVIIEVEQLLRRTLGEHVRLHTELAPGLWPVLADPGQIEQVLVNLAVNARDAMPQGGTLTVHTLNHEVHEPPPGTTPAVRPGRYARIRIADTGTGMPPDVLDRVFEPFFTTKPKGQGTGLGLATVYGIISQAGGYTTVQSAPGAGTAFIALIPATDDIPEPATAPPARRPRPGGETILVVEDEDALREVTRRILTRSGYRVHTAANGPEAIKIAENHDQVIDLVLTDVVMPHMQGKDLADRLHTIRPDLPVVFMSGYAEPFVVTDGALHPDVNLVTKPFTEADLLDTLQRTLAGA